MNNQKVTLGSIIKELESLVGMLSDIKGTESKPHGNKIMKCPISLDEKMK